MPDKLIDQSIVQHVARLSALAISPEEAQNIEHELNEILEYVSRLSEVSTDGVRPTSHVHGVVNAFREDIVQDSLDIDSVKNNAPSFSNGGFKVPKVI